MDSGSRFPPVICAGLYSSGSTWAYNVVRALLRHVVPGRVASFFAEDIAAPQDALLQSSDAAVIKCHRPSPAMLTLMRLARLPVILTLRDPRDGVASVMERFGLGFGEARGQLATSAQAALRMLALPRVLPLRYEDGVIGEARTIRAIADHLGIAVDDAAVDRIAASLSAEAVRAHVATLEAEGRFGNAPPALATEAETEWHPGHVGDGRIGKHRDLLLPTQAAAVLHQNREFCRAFAYGREADAGLPSPSVLCFSPDEPGSAFLGAGFSPVDDFGASGWGAWTNGELAEIVLPVRPAAGRSLHLALIALPSPAFWELGPARVLVRVNGEPALEIEPRVPAGSQLRLGYRTMLSGQPVGEVRIEFEFAGLRSPVELGVNGDGRLLGLALMRLELAVD